MPECAGGKVPGIPVKPSFCGLALEMQKRTNHLTLMKPNLVVVLPAEHHMDPVVEQFCEDCGDSHYVYLIIPNSEFREDSPAGVRFLGHPLDRLPRFGKVDIAIAVADPVVADRLKECYPESKLALWDPAENDGGLPQRIASLVRPRVVRGLFGESENRDFARAM